MSVSPLFINLVLALWRASNGAYFSPSAYSLNSVMAVNGSTTDGGCPASCLGVESTLSTCNCPLHAGLPANATAGVLLDDVVPILNVSAGNGSVWAAPLLTLEGSGSTTKLMVQFKTRVSLVEIELYLFYCRSWGIGTGSILVYQFETFPNFTRTMSSLGSVTLTGEMEDCESVIRVTIPLMEANSTAYVLEFRNPSGDPIMWVHIAEARFSDVATTVPDMNVTLPPPEATTEDDMAVITGNDTDLFPSSSALPSPSIPDTMSTRQSPTATPTMLPTSGAPTSTRQKSGQASLDERSSSYLALVGVAVIVIVSLFVLLVVSVIILSRMRRKFNKAEEQKAVSPVVRIPSVRRHTVF